MEHSEASCLLPDLRLAVFTASLELCLRLRVCPLKVRSVTDGDPSEVAEMNDRDRNGRTAFLFYDDPDKAGAGMQIKAILFDLDGTLVDSNDMHVSAWKQAFAGIGAEFESAAIHEQIGKGADMLLPALLPDLDDPTRDKLSKAHDDIFRSQFRRDVQAFPGARELLSHVHELGQKVVLASSASRDDLDHYLNLLQAQDIVTASTSSGDVKNTKPAPDIFSVALAKLGGVSNLEAVVVGDTPYDVQAARKCGVATVALRSGGFADEVLKEAGAIAIYDNVSALLNDYQSSPLGK